MKQGIVLFFVCVVAPVTGVNANESAFHSSGIQRDATQAIFDYIDELTNIMDLLALASVAIQSNLNSMEKLRAEKQIRFEKIGESCTLYEEQIEVPDALLEACENLRDCAEEDIEVFQAKLNDMIELMKLQYIPSEVSCIVKKAVDESLFGQKLRDVTASLMGIYETIARVDEELYRAESLVILD